MDMDHELVVVHSYMNEAEAEMARAVLGAHDIPAVILRDTAGGMLPSLVLLAEVRLAVREEDEVVARSILDVGEL